MGGRYPGRGSHLWMYTWHTQACGLEGNVLVEKILSWSQ